MSYTIIDHGNWVPYTKPPVLSPEGYPLAPPDTMYCKRESDGADWYDIARAEGSFAEGSVLVSCISTNLGWITQAVGTQPQRMFPQNCMLIEVQGFEGEKPQEAFGMKVFDPEALTFSEIPVPVQPVITYKKDIWLRATDEEAETIEQVLSQQTTRKQRIYAEAQYLDHADPLFAELLAGFVTAFGTERAGQLLAGS
ncbi:hypothetical protein OKC48_04240 [Methylorubrum extorquens]|uniref:hypothetical protein n=1 Tax=Methylorubrum extorquens TaxID=408 RepID=UPI002237DCC6|nr:hypothetical protein [Methylorubrum extorquens]UYW27730.1 hypothetical protein OKC48_04240 [Methylorubrum extorquens]